MSVKRLNTNQNPSSQTGKSYEGALLLLWTVLGCCLRFFNLAAKPPWTDEFATMVFSLGNNYHSVLLNQIISPEVLLQPLKINPDASIFEVISLLLQEDNHPPLYFVLAHWWMNLWPSDGGYVSVWAARAIAALFGVLSIPAVYFLGRIAFESKLVGQLSAMMMAVSPYGVFIAQEARHYTLAILFVIFSLCCLVSAAKYFDRRTLGRHGGTLGRHGSTAPTISISLVFLWIIINCLGLAVHYFFSLTLCAQAITLFFLLYYQFKNSLWAAGNSFVTPTKISLKKSVLWKNCRRLGLVALGTITAGIVWVLMLVPHDYGNGMTEWIRQDNLNFLSLISPVFQLLAALITMMALLPIESSNFDIFLFSGLLMLLFFVWAIPKLYWGLKVNLQQPNSRLATGVLLGFILSSIMLFFGLTYFSGIDITRGARYSFVYFPAVPVLLGAILAVFWQEDFSNKTKNIKNIKLFFVVAKPKITVLIIGLIGLLSALTIGLNLGYQKYYLPNQLIKVIANTASEQVLIATTHENLVQIGEMMGIAWQLNKNPLPVEIGFLLAHKELNEPKSATLVLENTLNQLTRPLEVWAVNFKAPVKLNNCIADPKPLTHINGYNYRRYRCL